jgi:L-malate glycosyltransferase
MRQLVKDERPDLAHTYFFWPVVYGRILKKLGVIKHLVENREDLGFNLTSREYRALRLTADVPDRIICVSEAVQQVVLERENVALDRTTVIPNGTSIPDEDDGSSAEQTRRELGFGPEHLVVGMVANLNRAVKGVNYFIEALPLIVKQVPRARFLILGDGHERETHQTRAVELGVGDRVVFAGFQPEVAPYYRAMDLSVLTSLSEGFSISILESMSHGLPVVATRVGGNPELIVDGETGILVPPRDPQAFADAVVRVLEAPSLRSSLGRLARRRVQDHFSLPIVTRQYEALYRQVLNSGVER